MLRLQLYCPVSVRSFFSMASSLGCGDEAPAQANIITSPLFRMLLAGERGGMLFGSMCQAQGRRHGCIFCINHSGARQRSFSLRNGLQVFVRGLLS